MFALTLLLACAQDDRVKVDGTRVAFDDRTLFEGTWKTADVAFPKGPDGWVAVVVLIDGQERVRIPLRSLAKPIAWPPLDADEVRPVLKRQLETLDSVKTLSLFVSSEKGGDVLIYKGAPAESRLDRGPEGFTVYLANKALYRVAKKARRPVAPADLLAALNASRERAGLPSVRLTPSLSRACDLHALYLAKNDWKGLSGHDEDPQAPGFTEEGARAGKRSVISPFAAHDSPLNAFDSLMATLYHRVAVLAPGLSDVGVGWAFRRDGLGYLVVDVGNTAAKVDPKVWPVLYPAPGQNDVPLEFGLGARETPNPLPEGVAGAGYPLTVQFPERVEKVADLELELFDGERALPGYLSAPDRPARKDWPQPGVVAFIPKEKLKPGTSYRARLRAREPAVAREWSFRTVQ
jgi:hypothetical protein